MKVGPAERVYSLSGARGDNAANAMDRRRPKGGLERGGAGILHSADLSIGHPEYGPALISTSRLIEDALYGA